MPGQPDYRYDLFVSFAEGDRDWVQGYLLPALGLAKERVIARQYTKHTESFQLNANVVDEFERAITGSRYKLSHSRWYKISATSRQSTEHGIGCAPTRWPTRCSTNFQALTDVSSPCERL